MIEIKEEIFKAILDFTETSERNKELILRFIYHNEDFFDEFEKTMDSISKSNFETKKEYLYSVFPKKHPEEILICTLLVKSQISDFVYVLNIIEKTFNDTVLITNDLKNIFAEIKEDVSSIVNEKAIELLSDVDKECAGNDAEQTKIFKTRIERIRSEQNEINKTKISAKRPETHTQLIDKLSTLIFSGKISKTGEYEIAVESHKDKGKKEISTILDIDFSEIEQSQTLKLSKPLTPYDKRLYNVVCSLWKAGNTHISLAQIYRGMEQKAGTPNAQQAQKIRESAEKMAAIRIEIDNRKEAEAYNYPLFQSGRTYLLPSESITNRSIEMNGKILDYCLRLYREPPLLTYAMKHKQIALFTLEQAALPDKMRITDDNLLLDDYLKKRIARMKREKKISQSYNGKILYSTIYENCGIDNKVKRSRTTKKLRILLKHYQNTKLIEKYKERTDGITIIT